MMRHVRRASVVVVLALLGACAGKPMPFPVPESEMGPEPGLFTGPTGSWDIPIVREKSRPPEQ